MTDRGPAPPDDTDAWHVAALSMMTAEDLRALFARSPREAAPWVRAAAKCGVTEAQLLLGRMLLEGSGVAKNQTEAFAWFMRAAENDNAEAVNMVGRCYENGWGVEQAYGRAAIHFRRAAEAGDAWAQYNLGHLLLDGAGVPRDPGEAFIWYFRAAQQNHARAMNLVARCFEAGWGVARDRAAARNWYRKSAEGGYFRGAYNYATVLADEGCMAGAVLWFTRAIAGATPPSRINILTALSQRPEAALRMLAQREADNALHNAGAAAYGARA